MVWTYRKFKFQKFGRYGDQNFNWEHTKHDWICWENCTIFYFGSLICITRRILIIISWKMPAPLFTGLCVDHTMYSCEAKRCEPAHIWLYLHYDAETVSRTIESFGYFKEQDHPAMFTLIIEEPATELSSFHSNSSSGITLKTCRHLQNLLEVSKAFYCSWHCFSIIM